MSVSFSDIDAMLASRPQAADVPNCAYGHVLNTLNEQGIELPAASLKALYALARMRQNPWPQIRHPRLALFASAYENDQAVAETRTRMASVSGGQHAVSRLCAQANADLRVYELDVEENQASVALSEVEAAHALSYGLMTVEENVDYLIVGCLSVGHETVLEEWTALLESDAQAHPLQALCDAGGRHDIFALLGAVMAARMAGVPVGCGAFLKKTMDIVLPRLLGDEPDMVVPSTESIVTDRMDADPIDALMTVLTLQQIGQLVAMPTANTVQPAAPVSANASAKQPAQEIA